MSTRTSTVPDGVARAQLRTPRGAFAALMAGPADSALPPVLLIPGWTGSKEDFADLLPLIADSGRRAVAYDQRGQFETPGTDDEAAYSLPALAADALAVADAVSDGPLDLVGHSFGGLVTAQVVAQAPLRLSSATMLCSGPGALPPPAHPLLERVIRTLAEQGAEATWRAIRAHDGARGLAEPPAEVSAWLHDRFVRSHPVALAAKARALITAEDPRETLRQRPTPVLVLAGEFDDGWPAAMQADLARGSGAELGVLAGLGHSPAREHPARTAEALLTFLDRWRAATERVEVTIAARSTETSRVRHLLRDRFAHLLDADRLDDAELAVSELVTNAVLHARGPIRVQLHPRGARLVCVVSDSGGDGSSSPSRRDHGRGLAIVTSLSERCGGWESVAGGTAWCWLPSTAEADTAVGPGRASNLDAHRSSGDASTSGSSAAQGLTGGPTAMPSGHDAW